MFRQSLLSETLMNRVTNYRLFALAVNTHVNLYSVHDFRDRLLHEYFIKTTIATIDSPELHVAWLSLYSFLKNNRHNPDVYRQISSSFKVLSRNLADVVNQLRNFSLRIGERVFADVRNTDQSVILDKDELVSFVAISASMVKLGIKYEFKHVELNLTQANIIESTTKLHLDDIRKTLITEPELAKQALLAIYYGINIKDKQQFNEKNILDSVEQLRLIIEHPCPQNRSTGSPIEILDPSNPASQLFLPEGILETPLEDGSIQRSVYFYYDLGGSSHEPQGLLSLTSRNDATALPVTKAAVVAYIHFFVYGTLIQFHLLNSNAELKVFIKENKEAVLELLESCESLTLETINLIGVQGLIKLIRHPVAIAKLLDRVQIPVTALISLEPEVRADLIRHAVSVYGLMENISWQEIIKLNVKQRLVLFQYVDKIGKLIEKKYITFDELKMLTENEMVTLALEGKKPLKVDSMAVSPAVTRNGYPAYRLGSNIPAHVISPRAIRFLPPPLSQGDLWPCNIKINVLRSRIGDMLVGSEYILSTQCHSISITRINNNSYSLNDPNSSAGHCIYNNKQDLFTAIKKNLYVDDETMVAFKVNSNERISVLRRV